MSSLTQYFLNRRMWLITSWLSFLLMWSGQIFNLYVLIKKCRITLTKVTHFFIPVLLKKLLYYTLNKKKVNKWIFIQGMIYDRNPTNSVFHCQIIPSKYLFFLKKRIMQCPFFILHQKNTKDMNLTSHAWWEPGKDSKNAIYFHTKGHRSNSLSQYLKLAG